MQNQGKVGLFHFLILVGVTSGPVAGAMFGWKRLGGFGAACGVIAGLLIGGCVGYLPYVLAAKFFKPEE